MSAAGGQRQAALLVLIGPPGAGVSTVGRVLAERLGVAVRDSERDVERRLGAPAAQIFVEQGEPAFRAAERAEALDAVHAHVGVLALGGGAALDDAVAAALTRRRTAGGVRVIFLDVGVRDAAARIRFAPDPSGALANPRGQWLKMMESRRPVYQGLADEVISTDGRRPDEVAQQIAVPGGAEQS